MNCLRCLVAGLVQGVWFRGSTQTQARALGITGYARNLTDGRVEVLACGDPKSLETLRAWLRKGPSSAQVESVTCVDATSATNLTDFQVR
ncbi:Acylphosphatase [Gammaproteobacteria bacterium]